jgi:CHAT domain-containing protein
MKTLSKSGFGATLLAALALTACQAPPPDAYVSGGAGRTAAETRAIGTNARGEECLAQSGTAPALDLPVARAEEAFCGGWTQPSARVFALSGQADLDQLANSGAWRQWLDQRYQCEAPQRTTVAGGAQARLLGCTRRSNGAAHLALAIAGPSGTVLADGLPASLPVIERLATGQASAGGAVARSQAVQLAVSRYAADRVGAADEARFEHLMLLGRELNQTENFAGAEDVYRQALAIRVAALRSESDPNLANPIMHIALNLSNQGRFAEANRLFARAEALASGSADRNAPARLQQYRGMHALNQNELPEAARRMTAAEAGFRAQVPEDVLRGRRADAGGGGLSGSSAALAALAQSLDPQAHSAVLGLAESIRYRGVIASREGNAAEASNAMAESRATLRLAGLAPGSLEGRTLRAEGMVLTRQDRNRAAAERLSDAGVRLAISLPGERPVAQTQFLAGREWLAAGRADQAVSAFRSGAEVLRARRIGLNVAEVIPYLDALEATAATNQAARPALRAEAFAAAQLAQRSETARFLAQSSARLASAGGNERVANSLRRREDLDLEIRSLLTERDTALTAGRSAVELDRRIAERRAAREEAEADVLAAAPEYRALRDEAISAQDTANRLGPREVLVQIILGPQHSYALALRRGQPVQVARLSINEVEAGQMVRAVRRAMDAGPRPDGTPAPFDTAAAAELYNRLLRPVESSFEGTDSVVIVPDGALLSLPFGLLLTGPADAGNLATAPWLIRRQAVVHAPSVQALVTQRARAPASQAAQPYIGFGDFIPATQAQLNRSFPRDRCANDAAQAALLGRLPGFAREIRLAAGIMGAGSQQRLGRDFTAEAVQQARLDQFRIVHFATHGLLPNDLSCLTEPSIMVSNLPNLPDAGRAFLTSSAILRLRMDADLVILSACNTAGPETAGGSEQSAEALSGLARAFLVAGARGLLATHWLANDVAATVLMARMLAIQNGTEPGTAGLSSAQALQRAQLGMIEASAGGVSLAHPYYWAAFALIGDGRRAPVERMAQATSASGGG